MKGKIGSYFPFVSLSEGGEPVNTYPWNMFSFLNAIFKCLSPRLTGRSMSAGFVYGLFSGLFPVPGHCLAQHKYPRSFWGSIAFAHEIIIE